MACFLSFFRCSGTRSAVAGDGSHASVVALSTETTHAAQRVFTATSPRVSGGSVSMEKLEKGARCKSQPCAPDVRACFRKFLQRDVLSPVQAKKGHHALPRGELKTKPYCINCAHTLSNRFTLTGCGVRSSWAKKLTRSSSSSQRSSAKRASSTPFRSANKRINRCS